MKIGFIGLGRMGEPASRRILEAGYKLIVNDIRKEAGQSLVQKGATWAETPKAVAELCDVVFSFLPAPADVEEVACGKGGLFYGWKRGDIYVDMSTNSPSTIRRIAGIAKEKGVRVLDAPVTGGVTGARNGTLTIMVGGDVQTLQEVHKILEIMGKKILHMGDVGSGNVTKLVNNLISITCNAVNAEGMVLGIKAGLDVEKLYQVLISGSADNWNLQQYPNSVFKNDFESGFGLDLAYKDIQLALQLASENRVPTPVASAAWQSLLEAKAAGLGKKNIQAVILRLEKAAGVQIGRADESK